MARRRASGEGSIFHRQDKDLWVAKITLPNGKPKTKYSKKQSVVRDWMVEERRKIKQGIFVSDEKITLGAFLKRYLADYAKRSLRLTTYESYEFLVSRHIIPRLGHVKLKDLWWTQESGQFFSVA